MRHEAVCNGKRSECECVQGEAGWGRKGGKEGEGRRVREKGA